MTLLSTSFSRLYSRIDTGRGMCNSVNQTIYCYSTQDYSFKALAVISNPLRRVSRLQSVAPVSSRHTGPNRHVMSPSTPRGMECSIAREDAIRSDRICRHARRHRIQHHLQVTDVLGM